MQRPQLNALVDAVAFAGFVLLTTTGVLVRYVLPPGTGRFATIFGLDRHDWGDIHFWIAIIFFGTLAVHLVLHWKWIVCVVKGQKPQERAGMRVGLALVGLAALVAFAAAPFVAPIEKTGAPGGRHGIEVTGDEEDQTIRGSMSLREVADSAGMSVQLLISRLGLPENTDPDERLGRLSRSQGLSLSKVRQVLDEHQASR